LLYPKCEKAKITAPYCTYTLIPLFKETERALFFLFVLHISDRTVQTEQIIKCRFRNVQKALRVEKE
jgi:hypothetical protein